MATGSRPLQADHLGHDRANHERRELRFGFGIYYWMINLGAFLAPLLVSYLQAGSLDVRLLRLGGLLRADAVLAAVRLPGAAERPASTKRLGQVLSDAGDGAGRLAFHAHDRRLLRLLDPLLPELRDGALVRPRLRRQGAGESSSSPRASASAVSVRRRPRDGHQCRHDHPPAGRRQPDRQEPQAAADDDRRHR